MISYSCVHKGFRTSTSVIFVRLFTYCLLFSRHVPIFKKSLFAFVKSKTSHHDITVYGFTFSVVYKSQLRSCYRGPVVLILYFQWGEKANKKLEESWLHLSEKNKPIALCNIDKK